MIVTDIPRFRAFRSFRGFGDETDYYYDSEPAPDPTGGDPSGAVDSEGDSVITHEEATPSTSTSSPSTSSPDWLNIGSQVITGIASATPTIIGLITGKNPGAVPVRAGVAGQAAAGTVVSTPKKLPGSGNSTMLLALGGAALIGVLLLKRK